MAHGKKRKPTARAKAAYGKLVVRAYKRAQPGGKIYAAVKKHAPHML
jgi:hypothetical protein